LLDAVAVFTEFLVESFGEHAVFAERVLNVTSRCPVIAEVFVECLRDVTVVEPGWGFARFAVKDWMSTRALGEQDS